MERKEGVDQEEVDEVEASRERKSLENWVGRGVGASTKVSRKSKESM